MGHRRELLWGLGFVFALGLFAMEDARAMILPVPRSLAAEVLSEAVPTAFEVAPYSVDDYVLEWIGTPIPGVELSLERRSLEWVRASELLALPRGRLSVAAEGVDGGRVSNAGFSQDLALESRRGNVTIPVALLSGPENAIEISILRGRDKLQGRAQIRFRPRASAPEAPGARVFLDPSCSRFGVEAQSTGARSDEWVTVGCRLVQVEGKEYRTSSLEMWVFWDNVGQKIEVGGLETDATSPSLWALRLRAEPGVTRLKAGSHELLLSYRVAKDLYRGNISLGIGPYAFSFSSADGKVEAITPMPTLYASYFVTETMRVVAFDATYLGAQKITDFGLYLNTEYLRTLDRRIAINLMLGVHAIGFQLRGKYYVLAGAPQGAEVIFTDFLGRARNLSLGGFIYPSIQGKAYYNTWLRWGSSQLFGEFNYIAWEELLDNEALSSRSVGITVGFPIPFLKFL